MRWIEESRTHRVDPLADQGTGGRGDLRPAEWRGQETTLQRSDAPVPNIVTANPPCAKIHEIWFCDTVASINFHPELYVDITDTWETKLAMLARHASQAAWLMAQYGIPPCYHAETQSRFGGYQTGCTFAEAFRNAHDYPSAIRKDALLPMPE